MTRGQRFISGPAGLPMEHAWGQKASKELISPGIFIFQVILRVRGDPLDEGFGLQPSCSG